ncbi:MAG: HlyC/CorC family transporter [Candidatus Omnitrophica bacterium]|nr:HlyC/CorC family transporter [Candidatus Omnitrophota bacterium]
MINTVIVLVLFIILAVVSFLFALSETAIIALSRIKLRHMVSKGINRANSIYRLTVKMDKFIASILIGNNFVNIAMSAIVTALCIPIFGFNWGTLVATFITAFFVLIFCEITPKIFAAKHTEKVSLFVAPIMEGFVRFLDPITRLFIWVSNALLKIFGIEPAKRSPLVTEEELKLMIEVGKEEGVLSDEERKMLHRIFEFGDTKVNDCMVSKENIVAVNINTNSDELLDIFVEEGHARLPVYSGNVDNIVGVIYARDLLYILRNKGLFLLQDLLHSPYYVLGTTRVNELLRKFQAERIQIAIVVDKDKKTLGLVTLEDLIEEIVGEIEEEHNSLISNK